jgi:hypothetical protein
MDWFDFRLLKIYMNAARRPVAEVILDAAVDGNAAISVDGADNDVT